MLTEERDEEDIHVYLMSEITNLYMQIQNITANQNKIISKTLIMLDSLIKVLVDKNIINEDEYKSNIDTLTKITDLMDDIKNKKQSEIKQDEYHKWLLNDFEGYGNA
jgi:hypothetical protein